MDIFTQNVGPREQRLYTNERFQRGLGASKKEENPIAHALQQVQKLQEKTQRQDGPPKKLASTLARKRKLLGIMPQRNQVALKKRMLTGSGLKLAGAGLSMAGGMKYGTHPCTTSCIKKPARLPMKTQEGKGFKKFIKQFPERLTTTAMTGYPAIIPGTPVLSELVGSGPEEHTGYAKGVLVQRAGQAGTGLSMPTFKGIVASGCDWAVGKLVDVVEEMTGMNLSDVEKRIEGYLEAAQDTMAQGEEALQQVQQTATDMAAPTAAQLGFGLVGTLRKELKGLAPRFKKDIGTYAYHAANKILPKIGLDPRENPGIQRALTQGIARISRQAVNGQRGEGIMKSIKNLGKKIGKAAKMGYREAKKFIAKNPELMTAIQTVGAVAPLALM
jgi:hypothetical protein